MRGREGSRIISRHRDGRSPPPPLSFGTPSRAAPPSGERACLLAFSLRGQGWSVSSRGPGGNWYFLRFGRGVRGLG